VKVIGELKDVMIIIASNPKIHQVIDIVVVDILEAYGMLLSRDWSHKLQGYFTSNWSHLWFPWNGKPNKIRIDREKYLKHTITDLEAPNEPYSSEFPILGNYSCDSYFRNFTACVSEIPLTQMSKLLLQENQTIT
jgi:hypothetical protein